MFHRSALRLALVRPVARRTGFASVCRVAARASATAVPVAAVVVAAPAAVAQAPTWSVDPAAFEQSMSVVATVSVGGVRLASPGDRLAAFVGGTVRGVASPTVVGGAHVFFLTVYGRTAGEPVTFRVYDAASGTVRDLSASRAFEANAILGSVPEPLSLTPGTPGGGTGGTSSASWEVVPSRFSRSMSVVGEVRYGSGAGAGSSDVVAAFVGDEVRGVATPVEVDGRRVFFLTAYANADGEALTFRLASGGAVRPVDGTRTFETDAVVGSLRDPVAWTVAGSPSGGTDAPGAWSVTPASFDRSMNHVAALFTGGVRSTDPNDRVAAFVGGEVRGVAAPTRVGGAWVVFLTVHGRSDGETVTYKAYDASRGEVLAISGARTFATDAVVGSLDTPDVLGARGGWGVAEDPRTWAVAPSAFEQSMNAVVQVRVGGAVVTEPGTRVAALVGGEVRGVSPIASGTPGLAYLTVYGRPGDADVVYKAFDAFTGRIYDAAQTRPFEANRVDGQPGTPLVLDAASDPLSLFVYPGDGNGDGRVSQNDLFPISFYFGLGGPPRAGATVQFRPEIAAAWSVPTAASADMNGDGRISQNDLFPLGLHFGRSRARGAFFSVGTVPSDDRLTRAGGSEPSRSVAATGAAASLVAEAPAGPFAPGDTVGVRVRLSGAGGLRAVGFQMQYDARHFEPVGRVRGALFGDRIAGGAALDLTQSETGRFSYAATLTGPVGTGLAAAVGDGEVVVVRLRVRAGASGTSEIAFTAPEGMDAAGAPVALVAPPLSVTLGTGTSAEAPVGLSELRLDAPAPNPAHASARVRVHAAAGGPVRVTLSDVSGRDVATAYEGVLGPGDTATVDLDTSGLASGLYLVRARSAQGSATRLLVVRH